MIVQHPAPDSLPQMPYTLAGKLAVHKLAILNEFLMHSAVNAEKKLHVCALSSVNIFFFIDTGFSTATNIASS